MATRFWVSGGNGNWSSTTNWSASSGSGLNGASVPGFADTAIFNSSSGSGTATLDSSVTLNGLTMTGFTGTLAFGTNTISLNAATSGFTGDTTYNVTGTPLLISTYTGSSSRSWAMGATSETKSISVNISSGAGSVYITGNVRNLIFSGSFTGVYRDNTNTIYGDLTFKTGMSITSVTGASTRTFAGTGAVGNSVQKITSAGLVLDFPVTFSGTSTYQLQDALTIGSLRSRTVTLTTGTIDLNNNDLTLYGVFSSSNTNTRSIAFGTASIKMTYTSGQIWDCATITNFTRTGYPLVQFTAAAASTLTVSHGQTSSSPSNEDTSFSFAFTAGSPVILFSANCLDLINTSTGTRASGSLGVVRLWGGFTGRNIFGNLYFDSTKSAVQNINMTYSPLANSTDYYNYSSTISSGNYQLTGNSQFSSIYLFNCTFSQNGYSLTTQDWSATSCISITLNSTINLVCNFTGTGCGFRFYSIPAGVVNSTGLTLNYSGTTGQYTNFGGPTTDADGNPGFSAYNFIIPTFNNNCPYLAFYDITITSFTNNYSGAHILFHEDQTFYVTNLTLLVPSILSNYDSSLAPGILSKSSGTVSVSNQQISHLRATGGALWLAPTSAGNVDGGINTGWIFGAYSVNNSKFLAFF